MSFFKAYRKRGFGLTLETLSEFKNNEAIESEFFQKLKEKNSYLNEFYRVKDELLRFGLIAYKLDEEYNKVVYITEKGKVLLNKIKKIDELLESDDVE